MAKKETIFISIASYRDTELEPTIKNCMDQADDNSRLIFHIHRQFDKNDSSSMNVSKGIRQLDNVNVIDTPASKSNGVCEIRHQLQSRYDGEDYILQLDSHHRFAKNWDRDLIDEIQALKKKHKRPLLTAYLPSYEPGDDKKRVTSPWEMRFDRFLPQGPAMPKPETIDEFMSLKSPVRGYFLSGHFIFAEGEFYERVKYDPGLYFHGEEISLSVRAFTHGFDIFHPHRVYAWHHYTRSGSKRHWDDNKKWDEMNKKSFARYRRLVGIDPIDKKDPIGEYGLGTERTMAQYTRYSGIDLKNKRIHQHNLDRQRPPLKYGKGEYKSKFCKKIRYCIDLYKGSVPLSDYDVWVTAFKDEQGDEIYRKDYSTNEISMLKDSVDNDDNFYKIWAEFESPTEPVEWLVWPHSKSKDWCERIVNQISIA